MIAGVSERLSSSTLAPAASDYAMSIVETIPGPLVVVDDQMRTRVVNSAFCRLFDVTREESVDRPLLELGNGQWNIPALEAVLRSVIADARVVEDFEVTHEFQSIGLRIMSLNARELNTPPGGGRMILLAIVDVTERRRTEATLAWHTREIQRSNRELEEFAYVASHDLQEPLRKIRAYADLLLTDCGKSLDDTGREYLQRMMNAGGRMQTLITDLLMLSRIGVVRRSLAEVHLGDLVQGVLEDLEISIRESGATVDIEKLPVVEADAAQMRQLFQNLISNAIKFRREGVMPSVSIRASRAAKDDLHGHAAPPAYTITVSDNGIGFEARHAELIFGAFQRLHPRCGAYPGSGMGLTICRKIVECHGGLVSATSEPGSGSEFHFTLPVRQLIAG